MATNASVLGRGAAGVTFPFGHPGCHVCGTCKRERIRLHQAAGRAVVFVDPAGEANQVFTSLANCHDAQIFFAIFFLFFLGTAVAVQIDGQQQHTATHPCAGQRRLTTGMTGPHHDDVVFFSINSHSDKP